MLRVLLQYMVQKKTNTARPVIIHGIYHAQASCRAAIGNGHSVTIWSALGASSYMGPRWFYEIIRMVRSEFPNLQILGILDCGDQPGDALAAIETGIEALALTGKPSTIRSIREIADQAGVNLHSRPSNKLDLANCMDAEACCRRWVGIQI